MPAAPLLLRQLDAEWDRLAGTPTVRHYLRHLSDIEPRWRLHTPTK